MEVYFAAVKLEYKEFPIVVPSSVVSVTLKDVPFRVKRTGCHFNSAMLSIFKTCPFRIGEIDHCKTGVPGWLLWLGS